MEELCTVKLAIADRSAPAGIFTAEFPKWSLPGIGDHILVNKNSSQIVFLVQGKTHVFENGRFKEILYAVSIYEAPE
ncbi:hypothetical protein [Dyadobacter sp. NIV53]|uniref:hypothetical protein n=1 Tax=Dyadobacter sp. NIV53 TaxID=2861765 RepID=UPI001C86AA19|nr:hypothetical protein [Dyadobacter sp. NIV53]